MSKEQVITAKEIAMLLFGILMSVLGAFQAYVVSDMSSDIKELKEVVTVQERRTEDKFDYITENFVRKEEHNKDVRQLNQDMVYFKQLYLNRREDQ